MLFRTLILRNLVRNRLRTALTVLGIALGIAVLLAINLANQAALQQFRTSIDVIAGKSTLEIRPLAAPDMPEQVLGRLRWLWAFDSDYTPVLEQTAVWPDPASPEVIQAFGVDMLKDTDFRDYAWAPEGEPEDFLRIFQNRQVFITEDFARRHHLTRGQEFTLLVNDRVQHFVVAGILAPTGLGQAYGSNLMMMDIGSFQAAFGAQGRLQRIEMTVPEKWVPVVQARLAKSLPSGLTVQRPSRRGEQVEKMLQAFQQNLQALSFVSLLVGMFLIYNTMVISILRRRVEIGTLRALGMDRKTLFILFLCEALVLGGLGAGLGTVLGIAFAQGSLQAVSATVQTMYTGQPVHALVLQPGKIAVMVGLGLVMTVLAAVPPVLQATRIPPGVSMRRGEDTAVTRRNTLPLLHAGISLGGVAAVCALQPPVHHFPLFGYLSALLIFVASALCLPFFLNWLLPVLACLLRWVFAIEGKLSARMLHGALSRTAVAVASLMIGIALMISLAVMIGSFRQTVIAWVHQTLKADLLIEPAARTLSRNAGGFSPAVVQAIRQVPAIAAVDAFTEFPIELDGERTNLASGDFDVLRRYGNLQFLHGEDSRLMIDQAQAHNQVLVSEPFANRFSVRPGDVLTLPTPSGALNVPVAGIYYDYASEQGYVILPHRLFARYYPRMAPTSLAVYLKPGVSSDEVRQAILAAVGRQVQLTVRTNREVRKEVLRIFDETFAITYALHTIAIVVALFCVMNTLFTLVVERQRDYTLLRTVGAAKQQVRKLVLLKAGLLGGLGYGFGLVVGLLLSLVLIFVINKQSFGWTIQMALPWEFFLQSMGLVILTSLVSGLLPARVAQRRFVPEVLRDE